MAADGSRFYTLRSDELLPEDRSTALVPLPHARWLMHSGLTLSADRMSACRSSAGEAEGPRVAVVDRWLSQRSGRILSMTLHFEVVSPAVSEPITPRARSLPPAASHAVVGVVGHNFCCRPQWWLSDLRSSQLSFCVDLLSGATYYRGKTNYMRVLPRRRGRTAGPILSAGAMVRLELDQRRQELSVEVSMPGESESATSAVVLDELPPEASIALALGAGDYRVRILESDERPADSAPLQEQNHRELWDPQNVVSPLRTSASQRAKSMAHECLAAQQAFHEAMVEEAARLGMGDAQEQGEGK